MQQSHDPVRRGDELADVVVAAMRSALPSSRHAEMVLDAVVQQLGDAAVLETANGGALVHVFRRDRDDPDWIMPWNNVHVRKDPVVNMWMGSR